VSSYRTHHADAMEGIHRQRPQRHRYPEIRPAGGDAGPLGTPPNFHPNAGTLSRTNQGPSYPKAEHKPSLAARPTDFKRNLRD